MADIRVFFVTNRNYQPGEPEMFGPRFAEPSFTDLRFGYADFTASGGLQRVADPYVYPDTHEREVEKNGSGMFLEDLRQTMAAGRDTLVFIHGYNVSFNEALAAGARLGAHITIKGVPINVVVFSWPSNGSMAPYLAYLSDRDDARASAAGIARAFQKLQEYLRALEKEKYCLRCVHVITHSMGGYVLRNALQAIRSKTNDQLVRVFDQVILTAPDEDDDAFEHDDKLRMLPRICRQVSVYFNPADLGLVISDVTKGNTDRLGSDGPRYIDLLPKKVALVDCRNAAKVEAKDWVGHGYFTNSIVMDDIAAVLEDTPHEAIRNREFSQQTRAYRIKAKGKGAGKTKAKVPVTA